MFSRASLREIKRVASSAILTRKERPQTGVPDLLDLLLAAQDPMTERKMSTEELRDNLLTFIVAGHETTALTLAWSLYLCAHDPAVQAAARTEVRTLLGDRAATAADLSALPLTRRIVDEALRLYPPPRLFCRARQWPRMNFVDGR